MEMMLMIMVLSLTASLLLFVALLLPTSHHLTSRKESRSMLPPGNMGWPVIGTTFSFLRPHPAATLGDFMSLNIMRYGKIFTTRLLGGLAVVSADPDLNRFVLQNEMRLFEHAWSPHLTRLVGERSLLFSTGDVHKRRRSFVVSFLSNAKNQTSFFHEVQELASQLLCSWRDRPVIHTVYEARKFAFSLIAKSVMNLDPAKAETEKLMTAFVEFSKHLHSFPIDLPWTKYRKCLQSRAYIVDFIKKKHEERVKKMAAEAGNPNAKGEDYLDWLMHASTLSRDEVVDMVRGVIVAAQDTTWRAITLAIYFLQGCPTALEQLREEHLQLIRSNKLRGGGELTWEDYKNLQFTQCVIMETLRLGNPARFLRKKASSDIEFKGYVIPSGVKVITHLAAVHLDPLLFQNPEHFIPWRWLNSSGIEKTSDWMPFGGGARQCPGMRLTKMKMTLFLHHLIINYEWQPAEADDPIAYPLMDFPKGLPIKIRAYSSDPKIAEEKSYSFI